MKKYLLVLFFIGHLSLIFFQGLWTTIQGYWSYHFGKNPNSLMLYLLNPQNNIDLYYQLSGINTGYGFYGIKPSTEKYLKITFFDSEEKELESDRYFGLCTSNGISRLEGFASNLANTIADAKKLEESDTIIEDNLEVLQFKKNYIIKVLKWLGKEKAKNYIGCKSYKIELLTIIPEDIKHRKNKPELYVIQESIYPVQ